MDATPSHPHAPQASPESDREAPGRGARAGSLNYQGIRDATQQAMQYAQALQGELRRVATTYPTAEERAVRLVETALAELGAAMVIAWRTDATGELLEVAGATPLATDVASSCDRLSIAADCPVSEAARTGRTVYCRSRTALLDRYPGVRAAVHALDLHALAAVPARHMGRLHGVLVVGWTTAHPVTAQEHVMLRTAAGRLARAMAHARLYYAERAAHAQAERARQAEAEARLDAERARADAEESRRVAEDANRAKDDFLAVVSHELRTPLQAILGFSDLLEAEIAGPLAPRQHEYVRRVQDAGGHLLDTIENLLGFARAQAGKEIVTPTTFDAAATVAQVLDIAAPLGARKGLTLGQLGARSGIEVVTDERKVRQIVTNLVGNAVKFTERGSVTAGAALAYDPDHGERLRITVHDTGIGIPAEQLGRVFEPFLQVTDGTGACSTTTRPATGTGLGLSIVRQLARLLGGDVTVESELGRGSTFVLDLPRVYRAP